MKVGESLRILLVEDDVTISRLFEKALVRRGHLVVTASTTREALGIAGAEPCFDRVVCDWNLDDGTARPVLAALRSRCPDTLSVVVSGEVDRPSKRSRAIADLWLRKPLSLAEFCAGVERVRR